MFGRNADVASQLSGCFQLRDFSFEIDKMQRFGAVRGGSCEPGRMVLQCDSAGDARWSKICWVAGKGELQAQGERAIHPVLCKGQKLWAHRQAGMCVWEAASRQQVMNGSSIAGGRQVRVCCSSVWFSDLGLLGVGWQKGLISRDVVIHVQETVQTSCLCCPDGGLE